MNTNDSYDEEQFVLAAFHDALAGNRATHECYLAGVRAWRTLHPDQSPSYGARKAVAIMLKDRLRAGVITECQQKRRHSSTRPHAICP